jgi:hypothetical protein
MKINHRCCPIGFGVSRCRRRFGTEKVLFDKMTVKPEFTEDERAVKRRQLAKE